MSQARAAKAQTIASFINALDEAKLRCEYLATLAGEIERTNFDNPIDEGLRKALALQADSLNRVRDTVLLTTASLERMGILELAASLPPEDKA